MSDDIKKSKYFFEESVIETIGTVTTEKYDPLPENARLKYLGKNIPRTDGAEKVTGLAKYTYDIELPGMLHAAILRSPHANALLVELDLSEAKKLDGVIDIIHADNIPKYNWFRNTTSLFDKHLRYEGDEVACVVAISDAVARKALKVIKAKYNVLESSPRAEYSLNNADLKIHDWGNISKGKPDTYERGNIENGFNSSDIVIENEYKTEVAVHNPTEPHCSVANWKSDKLTIWDSTQGIFSVRKSIANSLSLPQENVRIIKKYMGGGFGSKLEAGKYTLMAALLSKKTGKPVKIYLDRKEMNLAAGNRPDSFQKLKIGVKKDGTILALSHYSTASVGAYPASGNCSWPLRQIYKCPNVITEEYSVITNTGRARPFRAPGHVQGTFALESLIDDAAYKLGMDPIEFRLKNYSENDQVWGLNYTSKLLKEAYKQGAKKIGWENRNKTPGEGKGLIKRGIGVASQIWWGGGGPPAHVRLQLNNDGKIIAFAGSQDLGTGTYTFVAQVAAEILEIPMENIEVVLGDTGLVPYGPSSGGSTTAPSISPAVRDAAEKLKLKLISSASAIAGVDKSKLIYKNGFVLTPSSKLSFSNILNELDEQNISVLGSREENMDGYLIQTFGAQFADVEVDTLTGRIKVKKIVAAHDIGRTLNRTTLENQFHGGIIQGMGMALMEEQIVDLESSKILNHNMHDYKMPTIKDTPDIDVVIVSKGDIKANSTGVKGIGEPAIVPTPAAIANAVYNAIGVRINSLPITPDKVINALYKN